MYLKSLISACHRFRCWTLQTYLHTCKYIIYIDFTDESKIAVDTDDTEDEDLPQISLQEMLDDLHIADDPMGDEDQPLYGRKGRLFMLSA